MRLAEKFSTAVDHADRYARRLPRRRCRGARPERGHRAQPARHGHGSRRRSSSLVIGEGGSGGALAIGVADRVLMLQYSIYSVISPEGCASILWKSAGKAEAAAEAMGITAERLSPLGARRRGDRRAARRGTPRSSRCRACGRDGAGSHAARPRLTAARCAACEQARAAGGFRGFQGTLMRPQAGAARGEFPRPSTSRPRHSAGRPRGVCGCVQRGARLERAAACGCAMRSARGAARSTCRPRSAPRLRPMGSSLRRASRTSRRRVSLGARGSWGRQTRRQYRGACP